MNALATDNKYETERYLSSHSIADNTLVLILAGGRGSRDRPPLQTRRLFRR